LDDMKGMGTFARFGLRLLRAELLYPYCSDN
jgi:hypothetical protein